AGQHGALAARALVHPAERAARPACPSGGAAAGGPLAEGVERGDLASAVAGARRPLAAQGGGRRREAALAAGPAAPAAGHGARRPRGGGEEKDGEDRGAGGPSDHGASIAARPGGCPARSRSVSAA